MSRTMETSWLHNPLKNDRTIYYCHRDGVSVEHMVRPATFDMRCSHFHSEYEFYFLLKGQRRLFFGNRSYMIQEGNLAIIDSSRIHMTCSVPNDPNATYERIILYLRREKVEEYDRSFPELDMAGFLRQHEGVYVLSPEEQQRILTMFRNIQSELDGQRGKSQTLIDLEIMQFFIRFWRENCPASCLFSENEPQKNGKYATVYAVSDYISTHFCEQLTLEKLAEEFYVSKSYLSRSFKEVVGFGFKEYVNILRIQMAQKLLERPNLTISQISEMVGFDNTSYFGQVFQKHLAVSPSQYRRDFLAMKTKP